MNTLVIEHAHNNGQAPSQPISVSSLKSRIGVPDPQVIQKPTRRRFSVADKLRILKEADACHKPGELGALLRREGIYSSSLQNFRKQRAQGRLRQKNIEQKVIQRKQKEADRQRDARKIVQMQKEIQQLTGLLELQKKLSDLLGIHLQNLTTNDCE
jgi:transposase-like protein